MEISTATANEYFQKLKTTRLEVLTQAVDSLIESWSMPHVMPTVAAILEECDVQAQNLQVHSDSRRLLERNDKPPDWETLGKRAGVTPEQVQEWLEAGKEAQREHLAKLAEDPEWRAMAARLGGFPGLMVKPSQVPRDPKERQAWSHRRAREGGWLD